jgi:hypothetical protein
MAWDPVPDHLGLPTVRSLHQWSRVVGKIRLALTEPLPDWWQIARQVSPCGPTTSPIPYRRGMIELEFELRRHVLDLRRSDGRRWFIALRPMPVAEFNPETRSLMASADIGVRIRPVLIMAFREATAKVGATPRRMGPRRPGTGAGPCSRTEVRRQAPGIES